MLFTLHPLKMANWRAMQEKIFQTQVTTHAATSRHRKTKLGVEGDARDIDYWWDGALGRGSSGWSAVKAAKLMGFDQVVMCGVPLEKGTYAHFDGNFPKAWGRQDTIDHYRRGVMDDIEWHDRVYSMSGWTRDTLGEPPHEHRATL
jgi:hypothetical protein